MSQNDIARDMTQGPVLRQLAIFAIPVALANALQAIYSMVDMVVVGQVVGSSGLSAVGIGGSAAEHVPVHRHGLQLWRTDSAEPAGWRKGS